MLIRFDFIGGPKDGESVFGDLDAPFGSAAGYFHVTLGGSPGSLLWCRPEYLVELTQILSDSALLDLHVNGSPLRGHLYEVFCRSRGTDDMLIRVRHVGPVPTRADMAQVPLTDRAGLPEPSARASLSSSSDWSLRQTRTEEAGH